MTQLFLTVFWLCIFFLLCFSLGRFLFFRTIPEDGRLEGILFAFGIGSGLLGLLVFLATALHCLSAPLFQIGSILLAIPGLWSIRRLLPLTRFRQEGDSHPGKLLSALLFLLGVTACLNFLSNLAPPLGNDPLVYHLALPKDYIREGLFYLPTTYWGYPQLVEMFYTWALLVDRPHLAQILHWFFGLLIVLALILFGKRYLSLKTGLLAAVLFYGMIMVTSLSVYADTDLGVAFFEWLALYAFVNWVRSGARKDLALSAAFVGFAAGSKNSGLLCILILFPLVVSRSVVKKRVSSLCDPLLFLTLALVIASPWYLKNWFFTGNPFWPFVSNLFPSRDLDPSFMHMALPDYSRLPVPRTLLNALLFPLRATVQPGLFDGWAHAVGPLLIGLLPLIGLIRNVPAVIWGLCVYAILHLLIIFFVIQLSRYVLPGWVCLSVVCAFACVPFLERKGLRATLLGGILLCGSLLNLLFASAYLTYRLPVVIGKETENDFLSRRLDLFDTVTYANQNLEAQAKIASLDLLVFYSDRPMVTIDPSEQWWLKFHEFKDASALAAHLKEKGFTHYLHSEGQFERKSNRLTRTGFTRLWPEFKAHDLEELFSKNGVTLYRIK